MTLDGSGWSSRSSIAPRTPPTISKLSTLSTPRSFQKRSDAAAAGSPSSIIIDRSMLGSSVHLPISPTWPNDGTRSLSSYTVRVDDSPPFSPYHPSTTRVGSVHTIDTLVPDSDFRFLTDAGTTRSPSQITNRFRPSPTSPEICEFADEATCHAILQDGLGLPTRSSLARPVPDRPCSDLSTPPSYLRSYSPPVVQRYSDVPLKRSTTRGSVDLLSRTLGSPFSRSKGDLLSSIPITTSPGVIDPSPDMDELMSPAVSSEPVIIEGWQVPADWNFIKNGVAEDEKDNLRKGWKSRLKAMVGKAIRMGVL